MKKLFWLIQVIGFSLFFTAASQADEHYGWTRHIHRHPHFRQVIRYNTPAYREVITYYPRPRSYREVITYYPRPYTETRVYPVYPRYQRQSFVPGLAGGVVGGVLGYEMGGGDPLATGLGAAAGSYIGNEISENNRDD